MSKHSIDELNKLWTDGESADNSLFAEMRSNILLHSGDHYKKVSQGLRERLVDSRTTEETKLRLTKNHTQVVTNRYISNIVSQSPGVRVLPFNAKEPQDQKDAELSQAVWADAEIKQEIDSKIETWAQDFVVQGECAGRVYWDPSKGKLLGFEQQTDEQGQPLFKHPELGVVPVPTDIFGNQLEPVASKIPVFEGQLVIEPINPCNIIRDKQAESLSDSIWLGYRKMVPIEDAKAMLKGLPEDERIEKEKYLVESSKTTFKVFESTTGEYSDSKGQILFKEYYFRPSPVYPQGYFYITTENGVLFEGELPFGIFPIVIEGFNKIPSSARFRSIIKHIRGPQAEINRMASMIGTTQISLGMDKVFIQAGSKLTRGATYSGLREYVIAGPPPTIVSGQSGNQFEASLTREIEELYKLADLEYEMAETQATDPYAMLFKSMSQKKKYAVHAKKFERFLCNITKLYLMLAKRYLPETYLVKAVGKREIINLPEFKNIADEGFNIKLKPISGDIDSMMGMQLNLNQTLQYVGKDLPKEELGRLLKRLPFMSGEDSVDYLTLDDECVTSDILALDRGQYRPAQPDDNHDIYIKRLSFRMKQTDFETLPPQIQQMYQKKKQEHMDIQAQQLQELQAAEAGFIPSGGGLVKLDVYGPDGKRMLVPFEAAQWLVQKLTQQGQAQDQLQAMDQSTQTQIMNKAIEMSNQGQMQQQQNGMGPQAVGMQQPMPPMPQH